MNRPCPLCGGGEGAALHAMRFSLPAESRLPVGYAIVACARCGFVFADSPGSEEDYAHHYRSHSRYEDARVATGGGDTAADRLRLEQVADWIARRAPRVPVLDVGCGNGGLLAALQARGFPDPAGVDAAAGCIDRLRARGLRGWEGDATRLPPEARGFGLALLSHVLEHLLSPLAALQALRGALRPGGLLYLEVPDAARYDAASFAPFYFFDAEHINHFDAGGLAAMAGAAGFAVQDLERTAIEVEGSRRYPVVRLMARMTDAATLAGSASPALRQEVERYIAGSRARPADEALARLASSGRTLALWGAGSLAQRLLADPAFASLRFAAVVDRDRGKQGTRFAGCTVAAPEAGLAPLPRDVVVIVAAALAAPAIVAECRAMGFDCHVADHAG